MINLLPQQQKEELRKEESFKLVLILGITVLAFLVCLSLILFSIKILIETQLDVQKVFLSQKEAKTSQTKDLEKRIKDLNLTLSQLDYFYQHKPDWLEILETIPQTLPLGTYLTAINLRQPSSEKEEHLGEIFLAGYCPSRELLTDFKKNLEAEGRFQEVFFPSSNWVEPTDINFTVNFKIQ